MSPLGPTLSVAALAALLLAAGAAGARADAVDARPGLTIAQRTRAAEKTAREDPACVAVRPFYWSIGDARGLQAEGRIGLRAPNADTPMPIASASKLVYGAYVVQKHGGRLSASDVRDLTFESGFTDFDHCRKGQTVAQCEAWRHNGDREAANEGRFYYNGGHMQRHAVIDGEGADDAGELARRVNAMLGTDFSYGSPQLAGGIHATPAGYGRFLQRIVAGELLMHDALGTHSVCTNPSTCADAAYTPMPQDESPHYAIGHWVEDDPAKGDGAFSSAGAFGFYPWIDRQVAWWGVLARVDLDVGATPGPGVQSLYCGRRIRAAWISGDAS
jgi:CubicO group peptidase (beta-lactamase class C family)